MHFRIRGSDQANFGAGEIDVEEVARSRNIITRLFLTMQFHYDQIATTGDQDGSHTNRYTPKAVLRGLLCRMAASTQLGHSSNYPIMVKLVRPSG
jgi:hypothetical protein